jgi:large subunit ribosomal protein L28
MMSTTRVARWPPVTISHCLYHQLSAAALSPTTPPAVVNNACASPWWMTMTPIDSICRHQQQHSNQQYEQRRFRSNRSKRGLYDGKDIKSGNNRSFSMRATKRMFKPNVFVKKVYSETLDEMIRFHLTTSALRSIDKMGGLDNYLLTSPHVTSGEGLQVKKRIINRLECMERHRKKE